MYIITMVIITIACFFQPLAPETLGPINSSGISFLQLTDVSGDARETMYLFQRVSGGAVLQFGSLQSNLYSSYRTGLVPRHSS